MPGKKRSRDRLNPARASLFARIGRLVELALFPSFCKLCGRLLDGPGERVLCRGCLDRLAADRSPSCPVCGRFYDGAAGRGVCAVCSASAPPFSRHRSAGRYRAVLKDAILLLKYRKARPLAAALGGFVHESLRGEEELWRGVDVIVPVPLHAKRRRERGFNQAEEIGREIGRRAGIPVRRDALRKTRNAPPQTTLERGERAVNVRGAFAVRRKKAVEGKVVLLVDDVFTTGATLRECARALRREGAAEVRAVTVARA